MKKVQIRVEGGIVTVDNLDADVEVEVTDIDMQSDPEVIKTTHVRGPNDEPTETSREEYNLADEEDHG